VSKETQKGGQPFGFIPSVEDFSDEDFKRVCEGLFGPVSIAELTQELRNWNTDEPQPRFQQEYSEEAIRLIHADTTSRNWNDIEPHLREIGRKAIQRERAKREEKKRCTCHLQGEGECPKHGIATD